MDPKALQKNKNGIIEATGEKVTVGALLWGAYLGDNKWLVNKDVPQSTINTLSSETFIRDEAGYNKNLQTWQ